MQTLPLSQSIVDVVLKRTGAKRVRAAARALVEIGTAGHAEGSKDDEPT